MPQAILAMFISSEPALTSVNPGPFHKSDMFVDESLLHLIIK
jgi:hypothetical protein